MANSLSLAKTFCPDCPVIATDLTASRFRLSSIVAALGKKQKIIVVRVDSVKKAQYYCGMSHKIVDRKRRQGIKAVDLARVLGVCEQQARNYLRYINVPKGERAILLASLLGITLEELHLRYAKRRSEKVA